MISIRLEVCGACGACVAVCRPNALFLNDVTLLVSKACNGCGSCVHICPLGAITLDKQGKDHDPRERKL